MTYYLGSNNEHTARPAEASGYGRGHDAREFVVQEEPHRACHVLAAGRSRKRPKSNVESGLRLSQLQPSGGLDRLDRHAAHSTTRAPNPCASRSFQALIRSSAWNSGDMRGWFQLTPGCYAGPDQPLCRTFPKKRLKGFEPSTFCMATTPASGDFRVETGRFAGKSRTAQPAAAVVNGRGCARICGVSGTSGQEFPRSPGVVSVAPFGRRTPR